MMIDVDKLKAWIFKEYLPVFDRLVVDKDKLLDFINANQVEGIKGMCKGCKWLYKDFDDICLKCIRFYDNDNFEPKEGE